MEDPLHGIASSRVAWTIGNTSEALPGVATPLSWTFFGGGCEAGMRAGFHRLGVISAAERPIPADADERYSACALGRMAANIDLMARMAERMPGLDPAEMEAQLFGSVRDVVRHPTIRRYPVIAAKMPVEIGTALARLRRQHARTRAWWPSAVARATGPEPTADTARAVIREAHAHYATNMALHTTVSMIGQGMFDQVVALADAAGPEHEATALIGGGTAVEETQIALDLWEVSRGTKSVAEFNAAHGYQGPDAGQLHARVWRENPGAVESLAALYRATPAEQSPSALTERHDRIRRQARGALLGALPRADRAKAHAVLPLASSWIASRETGKSGFSMALDGARAAARTLAARLVAGGALSDAEDVFYLTRDELLDPSLKPADARSRVTERRARRDELLTLTLPTAWVGEPVPVTATPAGASDHTPITGFGASPGTVEGIARVVLDPAEAELEPGEVLVCATTDPSWVSLFVPAAAVVIDIGGQMSHGAIVARELGIPCVINTRDGTRRIATGDRIRVDGAAGAVEIVGAPTRA